MSFRRVGSPLLPLGALLLGGAIGALIERVSSGDWRLLILAATAFCAGGVGSLIPRFAGHQRAALAGGSLIAVAASTAFFAVNAPGCYGAPGDVVRLALFATGAAAAFFGGSWLGAWIGRRGSVTAITLGFATAGSVGVLAFTLAWIPSACGFGR